MGRALTLFAAIGVSTCSHSMAGGITPYFHSTALAAVGATAEGTQELLRKAIDAYRDGNYALASQLIDQAEAQPNVTSYDKEQIARYRRMVSRGAQAQTGAEGQLQSAYEAYETGRYADAERLAVATAQNAVVSAQTREKAETLASEARTQLWLARPVPERSQHSQRLLAKARQSLRSKDYEKAEAYANEADRLKLTYRFLEDSPQKVLRDIAKVRPRTATQVAGTPKSEPQSQVIQLSAKDEQPTVTGSTALSVEGMSAAERNREYRNRLGQSRKMIEAGHLDEAEQLVVEAEAIKPSGPRSWTLFGETPTKLRRDIAKARKSLAVQQGAPVQSASARRQEALRLLSQGRTSLRMGEYDEAEQLVAQANELNASYRLLDDTPNRLSRDIQNARAHTGQGTVASKPAAKSLLKQARAHLKAGEFDAAQAKAEQANGMKVSYGWFDDKPEKVLADISRARKAAGVPESPVELATETESENPIVEAGAETSEAVDLLPFESNQGASSVPESETIETLPQEPLSVEPAAPDLLSPESDPKSDKEMIDVAPYERASLGNPDLLLPANDPTSEPPQHVQELLSQAETAPNDTVRLEKANELYHVGEYQHAKAVAGQVQAPHLQTSADDLELRSEVMQQGVALNLFEAGEQALNKGEYDRALTLFQQVSIGGAQLDPTSQARLRNYLRDLPGRIRQAGHDSEPGVARVINGYQEEVQDPIPSPVSPGAEVDLAIQRDRVRFQQLVTETNRSIQMARQILPTNPDKAIEQLQLARQRVISANLPETMGGPLVRRVDVALRYTSQEKQRLDIEEVQRQSNVALREQQQRELRVQNQKEQEVAKLIDEVQAFLDEGAYDDAERVARRAYEIDPDNPATVAIHWKAKVEQRLQRAKEIREMAEENRLKTLDSVDRSAIPFDDSNPIEYPPAKVWDDLTKSRAEIMRRLREEAKSPRELEIERKLQDPVTFTFTETPLGEVVSFLQSFTGVNIVLDRQAIEADGLRSDLPVTLKLADIPLKSALTILLDQLNLTYAVENDVLMITTPLKQKSELMTKAYQVGDLVVQVPNLGNSSFGSPGSGPFGANPFGRGRGGYMGSPELPFPNYGLGQVAPDSNAPLGVPGMGGQMSGGGMSSPGQGQNVDFDALIELIEATIAPDAWSSVGGEGTIEEFAPNLSLVISQTQDVHEQIADLLTQLRRLQDLQVTVEVRFITLTDTFFERIGIDFDLNIQSDAQKPLRSFGSVVTPADPASGTPAVLNTFYNDHDDDVTVGNTGPLDIGQPPFSPDLKIPIRTGGFGLGRPQGFNPGDGLSFGVAFLSDIEVFMFLEAAQSSNRGNVLSAPKVTLFNGSFGFVFSGTIEPFVTELTPVVQAGAVSFDPTISQVFNGSGLSVQAVISADRRYVRLTLLPFFNNITGERRFQVSGAAAGGGVIGGGGGGVVAQTELVVPIIATNFVITTVSVPDGGTVLMGGLKTKSEIRNEIGTPILNKLPYVNRLFMNTGISSQTNSLLLMVTPRIIIQEEEEELLGKTLAF